MTETPRSEDPRFKHDPCDRCEATDLREHDAWCSYEEWGGNAISVVHIENEIRYETLQKATHEALRALVHRCDHVGCSNYSIGTDDDGHRLCQEHRDESFEPAHYSEPLLALLALIGAPSNV